MSHRNDSPGQFIRSRDACLVVFCSFLSVIGQRNVLYAQDKDFQSRAAAGERALKTPFKAELTVSYSTNFYLPELRNASLSQLENRLEGFGVKSGSGSAAAIRSSFEKIDPGFPLQPEYELYGKFYDETHAPNPGGLLILIAKDKIMRQVEELADLLPFLRPIQTSQEALALARFGMRTPIRFALRLTPPVELQYLDADIPKEISTKLKPPVIKNGPLGFTIERDVAIHGDSRMRLPPMAVRSFELVTSSGGYYFGFKEILSQGDPVERLLPHSYH